MDRRGFTLLELIMVLVIIGILISIAGPMYFKTVERSRIAEAKRMLGMIRMAQMRYYAEHASFTPNINELDVDVANGKYFNMELTASVSGVTPGTAVSSSGYLGAVTRNNVQNVYGTNYQIKIGPKGDLCHDGSWPSQLGALIPQCS